MSTNRYQRRVRDISDAHMDATALAREVAAMSLEFEDDLEEVGLWQRNAR